MPAVMLAIRLLRVEVARQVPGRIGDACVAGGASYADSSVGGCGSTGDGDLHLRFQPCYQVLRLTASVLQKLVVLRRIVAYPMVGCTPFVMLIPTRCRLLKA